MILFSFDLNRITIYNQVLREAIFLVMLIFFLTLFCRANAQILSIDLIPAYKSQRECAMNCFDGVGNYKAGYDIATELSCTPYNAPGNACVCRSDLQTPAVDALSSCVLVWCHAGADLDVSSATQIYKDYCTSAGYTQKAANVPAKTTDGEFTWLRF